MTAALTGHCHCGAIRVEFEPGVSPADLPLRACQCGFCRRHGAMTTSDPASRLHIEATPGSLIRYRFGNRVVDALICGECGCYVASLLEVEGRALSTLNIVGVALPGFEGRTAEPITYDHETPEDKLARRKARWIPTVLVEASPSA
jgi:hypothetical protein